MLVNIKIKHELICITIKPIGYGYFYKQTGEQKEQIKTKKTL